MEALAEEVFAAEGAVDILHNNAGIGHAGPVEETTLEDWERVLGVNLMGVVHGVHHFVPRMLEQGRGAHIVNTASGAGLVAWERMAPYCTSKFGVIGLTESLNAELAPKGIHLSAICPGLIYTDIFAAARLRGAQERQRSNITRFYERRGVTPDVVAEAVVDAIRRRKVIRTVPRHQVVPAWLLRRVSTRASQLVSRYAPRVVMRG